MIVLKKTTAQNQDFVDLVALLDADLAVSDGDEHDFYDQYNKIDKIKYALVAYEDSIPIGCGAIKHFDDERMEVKRMYVKPEFRGKSVAVKILENLEKWTADLGYEKCILETGKKQPAAIGLYKKCDYKIVDNYGQYFGVENSVCFEKDIL